MIYDIGEILKSIIEAENLPYVETLAGVVQTETAEKRGKKFGDFVTKSFPVYCPQKEPCEPNKIEALVPDSSRKSLFYMEQNGEILFRGRDKGYNKFTADLFLVGWLNPKKLGSNDCSITAPIIAQIVKILNKGHFNALNQYSKIFIQPISIATKEKKIFDKYKYSKLFYHLLEYPYDYFRIRIQVDFQIHDNCIENYIPQDPIVC